MAYAANISREHVLPLLEEAIDAKVILPSNALGTYRFAHALLRDALYQRLSTIRRCRFHERIARSLVNLNSTEQDSHLSSIAHHFFEAAPLGLINEAVEFARRAGDSASSRLAYEDAARHYARALELLELSPSDDEIARCDLLQMLGAQLT